MYRKNKYENVVISDNMLVGIGLNGSHSEFAPIQPGLKNVSGLQSRIKKKYKQTVEMTNTPYSNFEIVGYYTYKSSEYVYIQDQRGIKIQVSLSYFFDIINEFTIVDGRIINDCVWACLNSQNILVPVDSEIYKMCIKNTERKTTKTSIKDVKFGDRCLMEDGSEMVYLGYFGVYHSLYYEYKGMSLHSSKKHTFLQNENIEIVNQPTVSSILERNTINTNQQTILEYVNKLSNRYSFVPKIQKNILVEERDGNYLENNEFYMYGLNIDMVKNGILYNFIVSNYYTSAINRSFFIECSKLGIKEPIVDTDDIVKFFKDNGFKKLQRFIKVIDPESKKELEINISNK